MAWLGFVTDGIPNALHVCHWQSRSSRRKTWVTHGGAFVWMFADSVDLPPEADGVLRLMVPSGRQARFTVERTGGIIAWLQKINP